MRFGHRIRCNLTQSRFKISDESFQVSMYICMPQFFMIRGVSILIIFSLLGLACKKDKNSPALLFVSPDNTYFDVFNSNILQFEISGSSESSYLTGFSVVTKPDNAFSSTIFDTSFSSKNFNITYEYQVPVFSESININLQFVLNDDAGNQTRVAKILRVTVNNSAPVETTGNEMFSALSGKQDAYNLFTLQPLFSSSSGSSNQHIKEATENDSLGTVDTLCKKWISPAGLQFVRFNDFDYANALHEDMKVAYEVGIKKNFIEQLNDGDILLTRFPNSEVDKGYIAIKLVYVIDEDSTNLDRYIFNVKK